MFTRVASPLLVLTLTAWHTPGLIAEAHPDFTGTWIVESVDVQRPQGEASDYGRGNRRGGGFGGGFGGGQHGGRPGSGGEAGTGSSGGQRGRAGALGAGFQKGDRLTISQTGDALIVTAEAAGRISRYTFDDHETINSGAGDSTVKSKAHWDGAALVVENKQALQTGRGDTTIETRQIWSLNADGSLAVSARSKLPRGTMTTAMMFSRADAH